MINTIRRTERHIIFKSKILDNICYLSKDLYNRANYLIRQCYFETDEILDYYEIEDLLKQEDCYKALPAQTRQQILKLLDRNWKSFFSSLKEYKKYPKKFKARPKIPNYKRDKNIVIFTNQQVKYKNGYLGFLKKSCLQPLKTLITFKDIQQVRIIPYSTCYVIEVIYNKEIDICKSLDNNLYLGIDLGINNLATCIVNKSDIKSVLIKGKVLKSINQYYNKMNAKFQSYIGNRGTSNRIKKLTFKRNNRVANYLHHTSKFIINYCIVNDIKNIVIGKNDGWKQNVNIGKVNNQKFVYIPFNKLIQQITYKAEDVGINTILTEESYTSKVDHLALKKMKHHKKYLGKRVKRGLFKSSTGLLFNADINGALGILRKVIGDSFLNKKLVLNRGLVVNPLRIQYFS